MKAGDIPGDDFIGGVLNHGPLLLAFFRYPCEVGVDAAFDLSKIWYPVAWGGIWFVGIYLPWRLIGGDPLYPPFMPGNPLLQKALTVVKMIGIITVGFLIGNTTMPFYCDAIHGL